MSARSVACIDGAGQMYMAGTTADGEHFPTAAKLPCLNNQKVVQAACAHSAVFALAETGRVLAWGRCASGLLGMTSRVAVFSPKALKFLTSGPSPREVAVRFLAAGVHHCAAISDGVALRRLIVASPECVRCRVHVVSMQLTRICADVLCCQSSCGSEASM